MAKVTIYNDIYYHLTIGIWLFVEYQIFCGVFFGHSAKQFFAECHTKNPR
jgi:hypothetical protein